LGKRQDLPKQAISLPSIFEFTRKLITIKFQTTIRQNRQNRQTNLINGRPDHIVTAPEKRKILLQPPKKTTTDNIVSP
jgi:hypothetical protein